MGKVATVGTGLTYLGAFGLAVGIVPLLVVGMINPKSTAVGPGLLMVVTVPPSLLMLLVGLALRAVGRGAGRKESEEGAIVADSFWRGGAVRHERHERGDRAA